jgi:hypothetical protein
MGVLAHHIGIAPRHCYPAIPEENCSHRIETAVKVAWSPATTKGFVDHAVALVQSVIFMVTGAKLDERSWFRA